MLKYLFLVYGYMKKIQEGLTMIGVADSSHISRKLEVFYNPAMKLNRDVSVLLLNAVENMSMQIADPMAGTGVRSIRFIKELKKGKIKNISVNDLHSIDKIKSNFKLNKIKPSKDKIELFSKDASEFLLQSTGFDYIDLDPFGSPNEFLDASVKRLSRNGILGVTATDTAVLCGTYPKTSRRLYDAQTYKNGFMHESALRILARRVQLVAAQYDKALIPILSYAREHYVKIFFRCVKGKTAVDEIMKQHKFVLFNPKTLDYEVSDANHKKDYVTIGPLWIGSLNDKDLVKRMMKDFNGEARKLLQQLYEEVDIVGSYDLHNLCKVLKVKVPNYELLMKKAHATRTHYNENAIKTKIGIKGLSKLLISVSR